MKIPFRKKEEIPIMELSEKDKEFLLQKIMNPSEPSERLKEAAYTYTKENNGTKVSKY